MRPPWRMSSVLGGMGYLDPAGLSPRSRFDVWGLGFHVSCEKLPGKMTPHF